MGIAVCFFCFLSFPSFPFILSMGIMHFLAPTSNGPLGISMGWRFDFDLSILSFFLQKRCITKATECSGMGCHYFTKHSLKIIPLLETHF